jgi:hypothetical protein
MSIFVSQIKGLDEESFQNALMILHERDELLTENKRLKAERDEYKKALEFYADKTQWCDPRAVNGVRQNAIMGDSEHHGDYFMDGLMVVGGKRAREILKKWEGKE